MQQPGQLDAFQVFLRIRESMDSGTPLSLVRLNDGEGAMLGYPDATHRGDVNYCMRVWFERKTLKSRLIYKEGFLRRTLGRLFSTWSERDVLVLADGLKDSVRHADVVGTPLRANLVRGNALWHRYLVEVEASLARLHLLDEASLITCSAIHRLLHYALLYRPLLEGRDFVGIVSSRDVVRKLRRSFGIGEIRWYKVRSEPDYPNDVPTPHYPDGFNEIGETLEVPYPGALFLVGAGICGKIYCRWIKERGGVAVDVGSMFDSWAGVGRTGRFLRSFDVYERYPRISRTEAVARYNAIADFQQNIPSVDADADYLPALPECW